MYSLLSHSISHSLRDNYHLLNKSQQISDVKHGLQSSLVIQSRILDSLDSLGDKMESMLQDQSVVEVIFIETVIKF